MKTQILIGVSLLFFSCGADVTTVDEQAIVSVQEENLNPTSLIDKIFIIANGRDFNENCESTIECDCCSGNLYFINDSVFYDFSYCIGDVDLLRGIYRIEGDKLILNYDGVVLSKKISEDSKNLSTSNQVEYNKGNYTPTVASFSFSDCNGKLQLIPDDKNNYQGLEMDGSASNLTKLIVELESELE